ncbi:MAG: hypothetical protein RR840_05760 [Clostridium sp.]
MTRDTKQFLVTIIVTVSIMLGVYLVYNYVQLYKGNTMGENVAKVYGSPCTIITMKDERGMRFVLFRDNKNNDLGMMVFEKSKVFSNRYKVGGGTYGRVNGEPFNMNYSMYIVGYSDEYSLFVVLGDNSKIRASKLQVSHEDRIITTDISKKKEFMEIYWGEYDKSPGNEKFLDDNGKIIEDRIFSNN